MFKQKKKKWNNDSSLESVANFIVGREIHLYAQPGYVYEVSQHLNVDYGRPLVRPNDTNKLVTRIASISMFKAISTASKALGLTKINALFWILDSLTINDLSADLNPIVSSIITHNRKDVMEYLTENSYCGFEWLGYKLHPNIILSYVVAAKEIVAKVKLLDTKQHTHIQKFDLNDYLLTMQLTLSHIKSWGE